LALTEELTKSINYEVVEVTGGIPDDAVLVSEIEQTFYYTLKNDWTRSLFVGLFNGRVFYSPTQGIGAEYDLSCGGCQISSVTGWVTVRDYEDYEYKVMNGSVSGYGYSTVYWFQYSGIKPYPGTSNIYVDYDMYVNLLNGDILNGNSIDLTVGPVSIP